MGAIQASDPKNSGRPKIGLKSVLAFCAFKSKTWLMPLRPILRFVRAGVLILDRSPAEPQQQGGKKKDFPALETVHLPPLIPRGQELSP